MPNKSLLAEIILQVFEFLSRYDLYTTFLVSKKIVNPSSTSLLRRTWISAFNIYKIKSILSSLNNKATEEPQPDYFRYCEYTKLIKIQFDTDACLQRALEAKKKEDHDGLVDTKETNK